MCQTVTLTFKASDMVLAGNKWSCQNILKSHQAEHGVDTNRFSLKPMLKVQTVTLTIQLGTLHDTHCLVMIIIYAK